LGDALNAGYLYLEVKCLGCGTHQTVALNIVRRPKTTPIHELEALYALPTAMPSGSFAFSHARASASLANSINVSAFS
jgi:hypothetical protein